MNSDQFSEAPSEISMAETFDSGKPGSETSETLVLENGVKRRARAEIDTSAPFESVKEAVTRFGGSAVWRSHSERTQNFKEADIEEVEEQAAQLEKDLIVKERETLDVLKELESTKKIVEDLKLKLQKESSEVNTIPGLTSDNVKANFTMKTEKQSPEYLEIHPNSVGSSLSTGSPGLILMELKQAKVNLNRTTDDLTGIRASVESLNKKLEKEKISLEKTRERLTLNSAKILSLEEDLNRTRLKLKLTKEAEINSCKTPTDILEELQQLNSDAEQFKKMVEAAKSEVSKTMSEIEQTRMSIKTAEIRWFAAKKMEEAARATEAVALAEIKALTKREKSPMAQNYAGVTISFEAYAALTSKAQEAEKLSKKRIEAAMRETEDASVSKTVIQKKIEEATEEVKTSRKALEEAVNRVEAANRGKLAVEEALRKWRSEHGQKRRSFHNSAKFKNSSYPSHHRRDSKLLDVNGSNLASDESKSVLKPTLSIGEILSRKLLLPEEFEMGMNENKPLKTKVSLAQMLSKRLIEKEAGSHKQFSAKRKKFAFPRLSLLLAKQNKIKKKQVSSPRC